MSGHYSVIYARRTSKADVDMQEFEVELEYVKGNAGLKLNGMIKRAEMQNKSFKMHHSKIKFPQNAKLKTN